MPIEADLPNPSLGEMEMFGLPVEVLTPVEDLFDRARAWADGF